MTERAPRFGILHPGNGGGSRGGIPTGGGLNPGGGRIPEGGGIPGGAGIPTSCKLECSHKHSVALRPSELEAADLRLLGCDVDQPLIHHALSHALSHALILVIGHHLFSDLFLDLRVNY